jgi:hypothetical protein
MRRTHIAAGPARMRDGAFIEHLQRGFGFISGRHNSKALSSQHSAFSR